MNHVRKISKVMQTKSEDFSYDVFRHESSLKFKKMCKLLP